jgi:hypothetical protein
MHWNYLKEQLQRNLKMHLALIWTTKIKTLCH